MGYVAAALRATADVDSAAAGRAAGIEGGVVRNDYIVGCRNDLSTIRRG